MPRKMFPRRPTVRFSIPLLTGTALAPWRHEPTAKERPARKERRRDDGLSPSNAVPRWFAHRPDLGLAQLHGAGGAPGWPHSRSISPTMVNAIPRLIRTTAYIVATILVIYALTLLSDGPLEEVIDCSWTSCAPQVGE